MTEKSNSGHGSLIPVVSVRGVSRLHCTSGRGSQLSSGALSHFEWKGVPITWKGREQEAIFNLLALVDSKFKRKIASVLNTEKPCRKWRGINNCL